MRRSAIEKVSRLLPPASFRLAPLMEDEGDFDGGIDGDRDSVHCSGAEFPVFGDLFDGVFVQAVSEWFEDLEHNVHE